MGTTKLDGKVAIVTGGASGIGKATCAALVDNGAKVVVADMNLEGAQQVAAEISSQKGRALAVKVDVSNWEEVQGMVRRCLERYGRIDILVNDAGISGGGSVQETSIALWESVIRVNLIGTFLCCKAVVGQMVEQRSGRIISLSSRQGFAANAGRSAYASSKAGISALTKVLAREVGQYKINVNAVAPGLTDTPMTRRAYPTDEVIQKTAREGNPMSVVMSPRDIADTIIFLCTDESKYITGQTVHVNAGSWMP